jgi:hypothetical protein
VIREGGHFSGEGAEPLTTGVQNPELGPR